jgi:hypothetical protein
VGTLGGNPLGRDPAGRAGARVDLYWLPLGAGGHFVKLYGRVYEALAARRERRRACDLYHSALQVEVPEGTFVIEQAPVHDWSGVERGVVAEGAVGSRWAGRFRIFRYEIRLWRAGHIPDVAEAEPMPEPGLEPGCPLGRRSLSTAGRVRPSAGEPPSRPRRAGFRPSLPLSRTAQCGGVG